MFQQVDLFYRPQLKTQKYFNPRIHQYESKRLAMRVKQLQKNIKELVEDKRQLLEYTHLSKKVNKKTLEQLDNEAFIYITRVGQEGHTARIIHESIINAKSPVIQSLPKEVQDLYIPSDLTIHTDTHQVTECGTPWAYQDLTLRTCPSLYLPNMSLNTENCNSD
jgi:hypothetical protein